MRDTIAASAPDFAEPVLGRREAPIRVLHPGYACYFTARSSTSNIKVAFGGMTPPAPLAP
jgi:hypothetical protein